MQWTLFQRQLAVNETDQTLRLHKYAKQLMRSSPRTTNRAARTRHTGGPGLWLFVVVLLTGCADRNSEQGESDAFPATFVFASDELQDRSAPRGVIFGDRMIYRGVGAGWYQAGIRREATATGWRVIASENVALTIERGGCEGPRPQRVTIRLGSETMHGCGGAPVVSRGLAGTTWVLRKFGDRPAPDGQSPVATITFGDDGAFGGTSACNDVGGSSDRRWRVDTTGTGGRFEHIGKAGPVGGVQTVMMCFDRSDMEMGGAFWQQMREANSWQRDGANLIINFADGSGAVLLLLPS